jgi:MFS family permease
MPAVESTYETEAMRQETAGLRGLGAPFWRFFVVALFFDIGFGLYFFLINLYLVQAHLNEKTIGIVAGALTCGNLAATIPTGLLARRIGLRPMLMLCFLTAPFFGAARILAIAPAAQIALAFAQGAAMCSYTVCFAPAIAALSTPQNRTTAFSLTFGTGIGSGVVCSLFGGAAPSWLRHIRPSLTQASAMGLVLLLGCLVALLSLAALARLSFPTLESSPMPAIRAVTTPFTRRFLTMIAVWNLGLGAFAPFATLYLSGPLKIPLQRIGFIFSASQLLQVGGVMTAPVVYRRIGKEYGIATLQLGACMALVLLYFAHTSAWAIAAYLCLSSFQYMCNPAIYGVLMDRTQEDLRAAASASQNLVTSAAIAAASAAAGLLIASHGYAALFAVCACLSLAGAALTCRLPSPPTSVPVSE